MNASVMSSTAHGSKLKPLLRLLSISLAAYFCMLSDSYACSCAFMEQSGFIHANRDDGSPAHLPANARGVLFLVTQRQMQSEPPTKDSFSITEAGKKNPFGVAIQRLTVKGQPTSSQTLFRIGPVGGFQAGKTYTISRLGAEQMTVVIDGELATVPTDRFALLPDGAPRRRALSLPTGGSCSGLYPSIVQNLDYAIPPAYTQYRDAMVYFTQEKNHAEPFIASAYSPDICSQFPYGGSNLGPGKELVATSTPSTLAQ